MKRWAIIICAVIFFFAAGTVVGFRIAVRMLKDKVVAALGAGSQVAELKVGWSSVELVGLEIEVSFVRGRDQRRAELNGG
jgi:hypothetical protein